MDMRGDTSECGRIDYYHNRFVVGFYRGPSVLATKLKVDYSMVEYTTEH